MKRAWLIVLCVICLQGYLHSQGKNKNSFFKADNSLIQYVGRIDFSNKQLPRFWQPGVYIKLRFSGKECRIVLNDEILWGTKHNYIELVLDGKTRRLQTKSKSDTILVGSGLAAGNHDLIISKNTEANIGYLEFVGISCENLVKPIPLPSRRMEFFGNSITCGTGSDQSSIPCDKGVWEDQHNAWLSYGAVTARTLNARYQLSAVSGIGVMHSCCNMDVTMPEVFDKISMRENKILWDFRRYQPDVITICLGQNDGKQDSTAFCNNYIKFIHQLRKVYPNTVIVCLSSPMADASLAAYMKKTLTSIVNKLNSSGDKKIFRYFFSKQYHAGCGGHPSLAEHQLIAAELTSFVKKIMYW